MSLWVTKKNQKLLKKVSESDYKSKQKKTNRYLSPLNFLPIIYILFINNLNYSRDTSFLKKEKKKKERSKEKKNQVWV